MLTKHLPRFCHSLWINWDVKMYYEPTDTAAKARTTTLNEELGQIEYIFSDKTGTLTQNIMTFNKCSIVGVHYGDVLNERGEVVEVTEHTVPVDFSANAMYESSFRFYDQTLLDAVKRGVQPVHEFFRLLAICHTVMSEEKEGNLEYQAQSPDEAALTSAARNFGFVFKVSLRLVKNYLILVFGSFLSGSLERRPASPLRSLASRRSMSCWRFSTLTTFASACR